MDEDTAGIMVTNPNTLGLFEENIKKIAEIVHGKDGLIYCDGANMNALMGIVNMGDIGVDVAASESPQTFSTARRVQSRSRSGVRQKAFLEPFLLRSLRSIGKDGNYEILSEDFPQSVGKLHGFYGNFGGTHQGL